MNEELYPFIAFFLIVVGWIVYLFNSGQHQKYYKSDNFEDNFGDYFVDDIKQLVGYVEDLPKKNQVNIYENVIYRYAKFSKETAQLNPARGAKYKKIYKKYVKEAGEIRRENADIDIGYKNPKWLVGAMYESLLFSESDKMTFNNGAKVRSYLFLKMKELIPNNHNLKLFMRINNTK